MEGSNSDNSNFQPVIYQGQFGEFTITDGDRHEVTLYRMGLGLVALCLATGVSLLGWQGATPTILNILTLLYLLLAIGLGLSLWTIHIYLVPLHRTLQVFWAIGALCSLIFMIGDSDPLLLAIYHHPQYVLGTGFLFAALTGIFFKEAFCFNRLEAKGLTLLTPLILLGHLTQLIPPHINLVLISIATVLMAIFAMRKAVQSRPDDIGDKSVFEYLKHQQATT